MKEGIYRGVLYLNPEKGIELPFNFSLKYKGKKPIITIQNADERIVVDEISLKGDSLNFKIPVFDTEFKCIRVGNNLEGEWINHYKTNNNQESTKKVKIKFSCSFNSDNGPINITDGEAVIAVSYK